ncbi:signal transducer [Dipodascopsis tothii]|uniref:signal transducer n=1 Tax=Dipodascopsis tothii TaxID=44089 RepID=UPI0034CD5730
MWLCAWRRWRRDATRPGPRPDLRRGPTRTAPPRPDFFADRQMVKRPQQMAEKNGEGEASIKMVVIGDGMCGKTSLLMTYLNGSFPKIYVPTVFENHVKPVKWRGQSYQLCMWDTAGQEDFDRLRPLAYADTDVVVICFAVNSPLSLENVLDKWYPEADHFVSGPKLLVALKTDLRQDEKSINELRDHGEVPVSTTKGRAVADSIGASYLECSAQNMQGVYEIFDRVIELATTRGTADSSAGCSCTIL